MKLVIGAVLAGAVGIAAAQPVTEAERLYTEGQQAYDAKDYGRALTAWRRSYELSKLPALVFNIAQAYRLAGNCREAVASYRQFVALDPQATERADAEGFIAELEPQCPAPTPPPKTTPPKITPAPVRSPPRVDPVDTSANPGRTKRWAGAGLGVAGLGLVAVGVITGQKARSLADEIETDCADGCTWDDLRTKDADGRAAERNQYVFYGAGAAAVVAGGVLYWLGARDRERAQLAITPRADGATISWSRRW